MCAVLNSQAYDRDWNVVVSSIDECTRGKEFLGKSISSVHVAKATKASSMCAVLNSQACLRSGLEHGYVLNAQKMSELRRQRWRARTFFCGAKSPCGA